VDLRLIGATKESMPYKQIGEFSLLTPKRIIIIVRVQLIQLLRGLVTKNLEPENSRA
jgi:hypothetical protein